MSEWVVPFLFISFFFFFSSVKYAAVVHNQVIMTGIHHYAQSRGWLLLWRERITFLDPFPNSYYNNDYSGTFLLFFQQHWWLGRLGFSDKQHPALAEHVKGQGWPEQAPLCEFLGTPMSPNRVPKSEQFPYSSILCQSDIHSYYCIFHAPASSIPYFLLPRGRWYLTYNCLAHIYLKSKYSLFYYLCKVTYISVVRVRGKLFR